MRGADVGPPERIVAMTALTGGLFYDSDALSSAWALVEDWTAEERQSLRDDVPKLGFAATIRGRTLRDVGRDMVAIARGGLARRAKLDGKGEDETVWLAPLEAIADSGRSSAQDWIDALRRPVAPLGRAGLYRSGVLKRLRPREAVSGPARRD